MRTAWEQNRGGKRKINLRKTAPKRTQPYEFFASHLQDFSAEERELATAALTRVIEQIGAAENTVLQHNGALRTFLTRGGPLTDQQNNL